MDIEIKTIERDVIIKDTHIRVKSVFYNKVSLEKAIENIIVRKLAKSNKK